MDDPSLLALAPGRVYVSFDGPLCAEQVPELRRRIDVALERTTGTVILDGAHISMIDPAGLRFLLEASQLADDRDVVLVIADPAPAVRDVVRLAGVAAHVHCDEGDPHPRRLHSPPGQFPVPRLVT